MAEKGFRSDLIWIIVQIRVGIISLFLPFVLDSKYKDVWGQVSRTNTTSLIITYKTGEHKRHPRIKHVIKVAH